MPEHRHIEMRRAAHAERTRRRIVAVATVGVVVAVIVAIGVLFASTFPKPPSTAPSATGATAAASSAPASATKSKAKPTAVKKVKKRTTKPAAAKHAPPKPPLGMATTLPGSTEMVVATGPNLGATSGTLRVFDLKNNAWTQVFRAACRFGTHGLTDGTKRKEGDPSTPTGIWYAGTFVWGWHAMAPSGTKMPYRQTTQNIWWSKESGSTYNTWVDSSQHVTGEHLVDARVQYEFALSTGYNAPPNQVIEGRGTAIFLHVFDPPDFQNGLSSGCVTLSRADMVRVFQTLDPSRRPTFAIGTETPATATSIASY